MERIPQYIERALLALAGPKGYEYADFLARNMRNSCYVAGARLTNAHSRVYTEMQAKQRKQDN